MSQFNSPADLEDIFKGVWKRLDAAERTKVVHGSGAPPANVAEPYVDDTNSRLYFKVGGAWKSVALT